MLPRSTQASDPDDLLPELLDVVEVLSAIQMRHEAQSERLVRWPIPASIKAGLLDRLEKHRRHEREPYVQRLIELQQRSMALFAHNSPPVPSA
jgi:hypothetical protein